jgi:hypothetical protein
MATTASCSKVYILGDDAFNYEPSLAHLLRSDDHNLNKFFRDAYAAIRIELGNLPLHARDATPRISSLSDLLTRKRNGSISPAMEQVSCLVHLFASFIACVIAIGWKVSMLTMVKRQHSQGILPYPTPENSHLLGVGIGALAAAAISSSEDIISLIPAAVRAIRVALHVGLRADQEAQSIQGPITSESWAMTVAGISTEEATQMLQRFNLAHVGKLHRPRL